MFRSSTTWPYVTSAFAELFDSDRYEAPDCHFIGHRDILTRSLARYHFVAPHLHGVTLDVGCGRGYGFDVVKPRTTGWAGIDVSFQFLKEAHSRYLDVSFAHATGSALPFTAQSFDSIISFEVIEHIEDDVTFLMELKRLSRKGGFIAISTPNKIVTSGASEKPLNTFHVREYTFTQFHDLLNSVFSSVTIYGQTEGVQNNSVDSWIDRVPVSWKYLIPAQIQGVASVALRQPLRLEDCRFEMENVDRAHAFVALCRD